MLQLDNTNMLQLLHVKVELFHFSKFRSLVFDIPCFLWTKNTQIDLSGQLTSTNLFLVWKQFFFFFVCIHKATYFIV